MPKRNPTRKGCKVCHTHKKRTRSQVCVTCRAYNGFNNFNKLEKVLVCKSKIAGKGLFATSHYKRDDFIATYGGVYVHKKPPLDSRWTFRIRKPCHPEVVITLPPLLCTLPPSFVAGSPVHRWQPKAAQDC